MTWRPPLIEHEKGRQERSWGSFTGSARRREPYHQMVPVRNSRALTRNRAVKGWCLRRIGIQRPAAPGQIPSDLCRSAYFESCAAGGCSPDFHPRKQLPSVKRPPPALRQERTGSGRDKNEKTKDKR